MLRAVDKWLFGYLASLAQRPRPVVAGTRHLIMAVCDHYEPYRGNADRETAHSYVERWRRDYPAFAAPFRDADGCGPQHTFFYPEEEYDPACLEWLGQLVRDGCGEVEIHLHHRHDTPDGLREKLVRFRDLLHTQHGMLGEYVASSGSQERNTAHPAYAFIHGNWALCNSRPDGDWCGVNEELSILSETGCYADLTFPSAPSPTQPRMVNSIYRAQDNPNGRGHDHGARLIAGGADPAGQASPAPSLLLVQGPLALNFARRKWGVLPRIENGELSGTNPPAPDRLRLWTRTGIHVAGRADWLFVKLHTHGCVPANTDILLGDAMRRMHSDLHTHYNDGDRWQLHYVTAREMTNIILAAEQGLSGNPGQYRDHVITRPPCREK